MSIIKIDKTDDNTTNKPIKPDLIAAYHNLTRTEKYIVDNIYQFMYGVAFEDIHLTFDKEFFQTIYKCCNKSIMLYTDYRYHLQIHKIAFDDLYIYKYTPPNSIPYNVFILTLHSNDDPYVKYLFDIAESRDNLYAKYSSDIAKSRNYK